MAQIGVDLGLYKLPSNEILRHRKAYYDLCKRHDDETETWLNRIQSQINRCEFPSVMSREYLLIDKFVCELDKDQRNFIQSVDTWTLEQLKEYFIYANADTVEAVRRMKPNCSTNNISDENLEIAPSSMIHVKGELDVDQYSQNFAENAMTNEQMTFVEVKQYSSIVNPPVDVTLANTSTTTAQSKLDVDSIDEMKSERGEFVDERQTASNNPSINGGNESSIATAGQSKVDMIVDGVQFKWVDYRYSYDKEVAAAADEGDAIISFDDAVSNRNSGKKSYPCDECDKTYTQTSHLKEHKKHIHQEVRPVYTCNTCSRGFTSHSGLKKHIEVMHSGVQRPIFPCNQCGRSFVKMHTVCPNLSCTYVNEP